LEELVDDEAEECCYGAQRAESGIIRLKVLQQQQARPPPIQQQEAAGPDLLF
jgi:hypothetical protein